MKEIVRENGEDITSFIKRVCDLRASTNEDVDFDFGDGFKFNTRGYTNIDTMAQDIERDYNIRLDYLGKEEPKVKEDSENVEESEEIFAENVLDENNVEEVVSTEEATSFEENVSEDEVEQSLSNEEATSFEENVSEDEVEQSLSNEDATAFEENVSEDEVEQTLISTTTLESLHLLTQVAMQDGDYSKLDLSANKDLEKELEEARVTYQKTLEEKQRQMEVTKKKINDCVNERGRQIKEEMALIVDQKKEYTKLIEEFKVEIENLNKGIAELKEKIENGELSQEVLDIINKSKILEAPNVKASELVDFVKIDELSHIYKLKWNVEAYQEYLDFFYTKYYPDRVKSSIEILKTASAESKEEFKELMIESFPGAKIDEDGKIDYDLERDDPELIAMREHIALLEAQIKERDMHPVVVENKILAMMYERKSPEEIQPLLEELMSNVKDNIITGTFESDKERLETVNSEIAEVTEKIAELQILMAENEPLNEDKINVDNLRIERMKATSESLAEEIEKCDVVLAKKDNKTRIDNLNDTINKYNLFMLKNIQERKLYIANNGEKENDPEIAMFDQNIKFCKDTIASLKELRKELREENKNNKGFMTIKQAEVKKEKLLQEKAKVDKSIEELELDKQSKIDSGEYVDTRVVNQRKKELLKLEEELEFLNNLKIALSKYPVESLKDNILNYNNPEYSKDKDLEEEEKFEENLHDTEKEETVVEENNNENEIVEENTSEPEVFEENIHEDDLEEIIDEKPAKRSLLAFLKTNKFKKIAAAALAVIVTGVIAITGIIGHHKNKEVKEDIKEIGIELENVTEDTKVPEIMETVAEKEQERREEETKVEEPESIVDTSRIAYDMYKAADGDFISEDKVHKDRYDDKLIEDIIEKQANGETVYMIVGEDGVPIGYTDQVNEVEQTGKVR